LAIGNYEIDEFVLHKVEGKGKVLDLEEVLSNLVEWLKIGEDTGERLRIDYS
jgi:hypothetical protein